MKCENCNFCYQMPEDLFPRCHYEGDDPPCEWEEQKIQLCAKGLVDRVASHKVEYPNIVDEIFEDWDGED